jgi:hypothetical protein
MQEKKTGVPKIMKIFFLSGIFLARPPRLSHHADQVKRPEQLRQK